MTSQLLLNAEQLAPLLHKTVATVRSDSTRNPKALPPICRLPHTKRLLWRIEDVEAWLAKHVDVEHKTSFTDFPRKRGRPTKAEQIAKLRARGAHYKQLKKSSGK